MSRRDYIAIAAALAVVRPESAAPDAWAQWHADCNTVANVLAAGNARFDRARFLAACGVAS
jgi:hypothetical protein